MPDYYDWWPSGIDKSVACQCYSACFIVWASGVSRDGGRNSRGIIGIAGPLGARSFVGIHRAKFMPRYFSELSAAEAQRQYAEMNDAISDYLVEMDVPESLIERMWSVSSTELYLLTDDDLGLVGSWIPALDEWLESKCAHLRLSADEQSDHKQLWSKFNLTGPKKLPQNPVR